MLDLTPDPYFDKLVATAAKICGTPIASVTYLGQDRQHFKSKIGIDCDSTPIDVAFCAHTVRQDDLMIVPDARLDERFCQNPMVTGEPFIRFYAGVTVLGPDKLPVGTICVVDREPRDLNRIQRHNLRQLALLIKSRLARQTAEKLAG